MKKLLLTLLLLSPLMAFADPLVVNFKPPTEYTDNTPLADSDITEYKWDAYGADSTIKNTIFTNTGNMTQVTIDLPQDRYLICLYAGVGTRWSTMACAYVNMFEPKPPVMC